MLSFGIYSDISRKEETVDCVIRLSDLGLGGWKRGVGVEGGALLFTF